jgi:hypothetical protein
MATNEMPNGCGLSTEAVLASNHKRRRVLTQRQTRVVPIEADAAAYPHAAQLISVTREVTHKASGKIEQGRSLLCHKPSLS